MLSVKSTKFIIYLTQVGEQSSNQPPGKGDIKKTNFVFLELANCGFSTCFFKTRSKFCFTFTKAFAKGDQRNR